MSLRSALNLNAAVWAPVLWGLLFVVWGLVSCDTRKPVPEGVLEEYESLSPRDKMQVLVKYETSHEEREWMLAQLARDGKGAYDVLLPYLEGEAKGIWIGDAARGMELIHGWGYDLRNTRAFERLDEIAGNENNISLISINSARSAILTKRPGFLREYMELKDRRFRGERIRVQ